MRSKNQAVTAVATGDNGTARRASATRLRRSAAVSIGGAALMLTTALVAAPSALASSAHRASRTKHAANCSSPVIDLMALPFTGSENFEIGFSNASNDPAIYEINHAGGVMCHKFEGVAFDDKSDASDALIEFERQLALHPSVSMTGGDSTTSPVLLPVATREKIPFNSVGGESIYDHNTNPYFYRFAPPDAANGEAIAILAKQDHYTRIATVFGTDPGSQGDLPGVVSAVNKMPGEKLVAQVNVVADQPNYRTDVEKLLAAHPQVIITETDGTTAATFFSEMKQLGKLVPLIGTSGTPSTSYVQPLAKSLGASTLEHDFRAVVVGVSNPAAPGYKVYAADVKAVRSQLQAPWQQWPSNAFTENGYAVDIIFALAMDAAHSTVGSVYNPYVAQVVAPGKGKVKVYSYAQGVAALKAGKKIQYIGPLGPMNLNKYHNWFPNEAVQTFQPNGSAKTVGVITTQQIQKLG